MNHIIVFTLNGCGHCTELKKSLNELEIQYSEIEITENEDMWNQVVSQTGHNSLPTVYVSINGGDEGPVFIPERDFNDKDECLEIIKKYI
jgi:glutaredoxin